MDYGYECFGFTTSANVLFVMDDGRINKKQVRPMLKPLKISLFVIGGIASLVILVVITLYYFVDINAHKPRLEAVASEALGMEVKVGGRLGFGFFPGLLITMKDVHIRNRGADIVSADDAWLWIDIFPLLLQDIRVGQISLKQPRVLIERDLDGHFNFERQESTEGILPALNLIKISLADGSLRYTDKQTGEGFEADHCSLDVNRLQLAGGKRRDLKKNISIKADLSCEEFRKNDIRVTGLKFSVNGKSGFYALDPVSMVIFDGKGEGSIQANYSDTDPVFQVQFSLSQFNVEELFKTLSPNRVAEGSMDFSATLSLQGSNRSEMIQTSSGEVRLRGEHLVLNDIDIDKKLSRFESSQNFNLVDVGAFFLAGPIGLLATKGYNFLSIFQGSGGRSDIRLIVSNWNVERGVAKAQDVAMATNKNRLALRGGLDFVNQQFSGVSVAVLDAKGCPTLRQEVRGSFQKPVVEKPKLLRSLAGPAVSLLKKGWGLLPGGECEVFYTGSVMSPN